MKGIDVSKHNGVIDWAKVEASGNVDFAIIRAGYGKSISQKDAQFERNYSGAKSVGLPVGAYWYSYALTPAEAEAEARVFINAIAGKQFEFPVYFDIEERKAFQTGMKNCSAMIRAFCGVMEAAGYWCGVYCSTSAIKAYIDEDTQRRYAMWVAEWNTRCNYPGEIGIWQYSEKGKIDGISGNVDLDECYVDYPEFVKAAGRNGYAKQDIKPSEHIIYIPSMTAADVQIYLAWIAEKGAGNYPDTEAGFKEFLY